MLSPPAAALCATCYTTVASSGTKVIEALRSGIVVLLLPTLAIFVGILVFAFRRQESELIWEEQQREEAAWGKPLDSAAQLPEPSSPSSLVSESVLTL